VASLYDKQKTLVPYKLVTLCMCSLGLIQIQKKNLQGADCNEIGHRRRTNGNTNYALK